MTSHRRTFLKQLGVGAFGVGFVSSFPTCQAGLLSSHARLPRSAPEAQGVPSETILQALGKSNHEFHSFMMLRHGHVIAEGWWSPYRADLPHICCTRSARASHPRPSALQSRRKGSVSMTAT